MLKKLKNSDILDLAEGLYRINDGSFESTKRFSYAVILNSGVLENIAKAVLEISKPSDSYAEYEHKREELVSEYAVRDENGDVLLREGRYVKIDVDRREELESKIKELDEEYFDVLDIREKDLKEFEEVLNDEVELDIKTVSIDDVPDSVGKDLKLMKMIMKMVS
jgi:hypothetical protein